MLESPQSLLLEVLTDQAEGKIVPSKFLLSLAERDSEFRKLREHLFQGNLRLFGKELSQAFAAVEKGRAGELQKTIISVAKTLVPLRSVSNDRDMLEFFFKRICFFLAEHRNWFESFQKAVLVSRAASYFTKVATENLVQSFRAESDVLSVKAEKINLALVNLRGLETKYSYDGFWLVKLEKEPPLDHLIKEENFIEKTLDRIETPVKELGVFAQTGSGLYQGLVWPEEEAENVSLSDLISAVFFSVEFRPPRAVGRDIRKRSDGTLVRTRWAIQYDYVMDLEERTVWVEKFQAGKSRSLVFEWSKKTEVLHERQPLVQQIQRSFFPNFGKSFGGGFSKKVRILPLKSTKR